MKIHYVISKFFCHSGSTAFKLKSQYFAPNYLCRVSNMGHSAHSQYTIKPIMTNFLCLSVIGLLRSCDLRANCH